MAYTQADQLQLKADRDIPVTKVVKVREDGKIYSLYQDYSYELNKLEVENLITRRAHGNMAEIWFAFHSYPSTSTFRFKDNDYVLVDTGKNTFINTQPNAKLQVMDCVIPKGSIYYRNMYREIASNKIIPKSLRETKIERAWLERLLHWAGLKSYYEL